jgi:hypothetical protein
MSFISKIAEITYFINILTVIIESYFPRGKNHSLIKIQKDIKVKLRFTLINHLFDILNGREFNVIRVRTVFRIAQEKECIACE